jgi:hypothetical protein
MENNLYLPVSFHQVKMVKIKLFLNLEKRLNETMWASLIYANTPIRKCQQGSGSATLNYRPGTYSSGGLQREVQKRNNPERFTCASSAVK